MLPGTLNPAKVQRWQSKIRVGGRTVDAVTYEVDRQMVHVPGTTDAAGQSATGTLSPVTDAEVLARATSPWNRLSQWPPVQGTTVTIEESADYGKTWVPVFTGLVDKPAGTSKGDLSCQLIERIDRFTRQVRIEPRQYLMPSALPGGTMRMVADNHLWHINQAFETAGFYLACQWVPNPLLRATLQGSLWPEVGSCLDARFNTDKNVSQADTDWGFGFKDCYAEWAFSRSSNAVDLQVMITPGVGQVKYQLTTAAGDDATLAVNTANGNCSLTDKNGTVVVTLNGAGTVIVAHVKGKTWSLTSGVASASGTAAATAPTFTALKASAAKTATLGYVCVGDANRNSTPPPAVWNPTATLARTNIISWIDANPTVWAQAAGKLLDDIGLATCSHWGFDETGRAQWITTLGLLEREPVRTLTDGDDIIDQIGWSQDWQAAACQVHADFLVPQSRRTNKPTIEVYRGSGTDLAPGDTSTDVIHPEDGVDWIQVDTSSGVAVPGNTAGANAGIGLGTMFVGLVDLPDAGSGPDNRVAHTYEYSASLTKLDPASFTLTQSATGSVSVSAQTGSGPVWAWLRRSQQKINAPLVRAAAVTTWLDGSIETSDNGSDAPVYIHTANEWIGPHGDIIVANLANLLTTDRVTLDELQIVPDPRLQLGDRIYLDLSKTLSVTGVAGMVIGKKLEHTAKGLTMNITVLISQAYVPVPSWRAFEDHYKGEDWQDVEDDFAGDNWAWFEQHPIS